MCGIAGSINHNLNIDQLSCDLFHRGPDEQTFFSEERIQFYHHRLAIQDIAAGRQPMHFSNYTIIYNGEIYNHMELRRQFKLTCKTNSDTETILHLYDKIGMECWQHMDGMFAAALFNSKNKELLLIRDRAGKKPLYYYFDRKQLLFASELNSLRQQMDLDINENNIYEYLHLGFIDKVSTPYKNVREVQPGCFLKINVNTLETEQGQWWSIRSYYNQICKDDFNTAVNTIDEFLHKAIKDRVEASDLEVGSFLSGGIDSGIVTAIASKYKSSLKTFTVSFEGAYNEAPLAKLVAEKYETQHTEISLSFDNLKNDLGKILINYGEPFADDSAIPSYYVSKEAKKHLTVILNGDGGDEMFGGYRRYVPFAKYDFFSTPSFFRAAAGFTCSLLPMPKDKMSSYNYGYRLLKLAASKNPINYLSATTDVFTGFEEYFQDNKALPANFTKDVQEVLNSKLSGLKKIMLLDFEHILPNVLLKKMDIATMANSLEGRSPMLSKYILEYAPSLSDQYKIKGSTPKYILRKLAERYLPLELINQPKRGFEIPLKNWVENDLREMIFDYLLPSDAFVRSFVNSKFINNLIENRAKVPAEKRAKMLWSLFVLEVWYQKVATIKTKKVATGNLYHFT
ncbi:MAG: asparagine synthase (glutamine-hydrolyzing) [Chitinophagaceae bacterium]